MPEERPHQWVSQVNGCRLRHIGADAILAPFLLRLRPPGRVTLMLAPTEPGEESGRTGERRSRRRPFFRVAMLAPTDPCEDRGDQGNTGQGDARWFIRSANAVGGCSDAYPAEVYFIAPFIADPPRCQLPRTGAEGCPCRALAPNERPGPAGSARPARRPAGQENSTRQQI